MEFLPYCFRFLYCVFPVHGRKYIIFRALHRQVEKKLDSYLGREEKVLITEKGKNGTMVGRDINYRPVVLKGNYEKYSEIKCTIVSHGSNYLIGE